MTPIVRKLSGLVRCSSPGCHRYACWEIKRQIYLRSVGRNVWREDLFCQQHAEAWALANGVNLGDERSKERGEKRPGADVARKLLHEPGSD